jgi:hypothetical protein
MRKSWRSGPSIDIGISVGVGFRAIFPFALTRIIPSPERRRRSGLSSIAIQDCRIHTTCSCSLDFYFSFSDFDPSFYQIYSLAFICTAPIPISIPGPSTNISMSPIPSHPTVPLPISLFLLRPTSTRSLQPSQEVILPYPLPSHHATTPDDLAPPFQRYDRIVALDC